MRTRPKTKPTSHLSPISEAETALNVQEEKHATISFGTVTRTSSSSTRCSYDNSGGCDIMSSADGLVRRS